MYKAFKGSTSNANISCVGYVNLVLNLAFSKQFSRKYTVCKSLRQPILGADFLSQHFLLVDSTNKRLLQALSQHTHSSKKVNPSFHPTVNNMMNESVVIDGESPTVQVSSAKSCLTNSSKNRFNALLSEFRSLTAPFQPNSKLRHSVHHHIHSNGPPMYSRPRCLSPEMLKIVKAEFDTLLKKGIVSRSNSSGLFLCI